MLWPQSHVKMRYVTPSIMSETMRARGACALQTGQGLAPFWASLPRRQLWFRSIALPGGNATHAEAKLRTALVPTITQVTLGKSQTIRRERTFGAFGGANVNRKCDTICWR